MICFHNRMGGQGPETHRPITVSPTGSDAVATDVHDVSVNRESSQGRWFRVRL